MGELLLKALLYAVSFAGGALFLIILVVLAAVLTHEVVEARVRYHESRDRASRRDAIREQGAHLYAHAQWFSEDQKCQHLIEALGLSMAEDPEGYSILGVRERWRKTPRAPLVHIVPPDQDGV